VTSNSNGRLATHRAVYPRDLDKSYSSRSR